MSNMFNTKKLNFGRSTFGNIRLKRGSTYTRVSTLAGTENRDRS